ncbi:MAG: phenylalanine--tRNA ligase subunit beta, partial [Bradymonadaceae bacterium]
MKVSLNWLDRWVDLEDIAVDDLSHRLTMAGLEVDAVERIGDDSEDIVVGRIDAIEDPPDADNLVICTVDVGRGDPRSIACGATNVAEGDRVPTALPGSRPPALEFDITERELMGVVSQGMLCSAEELGLEESSEGLMILPDKLEVGAPVFEALELRDTVFEFDLTPNRSDCLSHFGVAREISALYDRPLKEPDFADEPYLWESDEAVGDALEAAGLTVRDPEGCPRYGFAVMEDVTVGRSPFWLKRRLASIGIRSVNNIVDVTNFILHDVGQPLHAFDLDELHGQEIVVRRAEEGETLEAIDHNTYELDPDDLVIADRDRPVAMAGVMGGAETEVDQSTSRILLECAFFDPKTVRRTSKRHGLHTDSSHRFERRVDPGGLEPYMDRALRSIRGATQHFEDVPEPTVLGNIGLESVEGSTDSWTVEVPADLSTRVLGSSVD